MEVGTAGVSMLEAGRRLAVAGIDLEELMSLAVSVDFADSPEIARHFRCVSSKQIQRLRPRCVHVFCLSFSVVRS